MLGRDGHQLRAVHRAPFILRAGLTNQVRHIFSAGAVTQITRRAGSQRTGRRDREARDGLGRGRGGDREGRRTAAGRSEEEPPRLAQPTSSAKSALSRSPPVHKVDLERHQRVEGTSQRRKAIGLPPAKRSTSVSGSCSRPATVAASATAGWTSPREPEASTATFMADLVRPPVCDPRIAKAQSGNARNSDHSHDLMAYLC